ncbi:MAG: NADP-dependent oxidoreductase [Leptospiraceae bacterium]|nr:NADP-dependent oxidoreductase [Leptospiraceae bacterium]
MKAILYRKFGGPEGLEYTDVSDPKPGSHEVVIRIRAAGVNPVDWKLHRGKLPGAFLFRLKLPFVPGAEAAGIVEEVGSQVKELAPGDEVVAFHSALQGGAYAEKMLTSVDNCQKKPAGISFEESASAPLAALTAYQLMKGLQTSGKRLLVLGASGGVGHFGVQIGKLLGADVTGVASARNQEFLKKLGCEAALAYDDPNFSESLEAYDVVLDAAASRSPAELAPHMNKGASYLNTLPSPAHWMQCKFRGFGYRGAMVRSSPEDMATLMGWLEKGEVRPVVEKTFPLEQTAEAHRLSETGHARGKIVLVVSS